MNFGIPLCVLLLRSSGLRSASPKIQGLYNKTAVSRTADIDSTVGCNCNSTVVPRDDTVRDNVHPTRCVAERFCLELLFSRIVMSLPHSPRESALRAGCGYTSAACCPLTPLLAPSASKKRAKKKKKLNP